MLILSMFTVYVVMDTFFITRVYSDTTTGSSPEISEENDSESSHESDSNSENDSESDRSSHEGNSDDSSGHHRPGSGSGKGPGKHKKPGSSSDSGDSSGSSGSSGSSESDSSNSSNSDKSASLDSESSSSSAKSSAITGGTTSDSYKDENVSITLKEYRENDTTIYVADVQVSDPSYLKTAFAQNSYGKNVTAKTSEIAASVNAVLAVNGDYYGAKESGYVIRNGKLYRSTSAGREDLVIYKDGSFGIVSENEVTAEELISKGAVQTFSFGPALVTNGTVSVSEGEEVGQAMRSNPRTAIGIIDDCHYVLVVSDGRTDESAGLSLYELAQFMDSLGAETAYNLDGGGSSTMYFNGKVVNNPTTGGSIKERSVSDIVYIG